MVDKVVDGYRVGRLVDVSTDTLIVSVSSVVNKRKLVKEFLVVFCCHHVIDLDDNRYLWCAYHDRQCQHSHKNDKKEDIDPEEEFRYRLSGAIFLASDFDLESLRSKISLQFLEKYS